MTQHDGQIEHVRKTTTCVGEVGVDDDTATVYKVRLGKCVLSWGVSSEAKQGTCVEVRKWER